MPISVRWEADHHIVIWEFEGAWTWEEYYEQRGSTNEAIRKRAHTVDMIVDMTRSQLLPKNLMTHASSAARQSPTNIGKTIFVGSNALLRAFFKMFSQIYGVFEPTKADNTHMVATLDEAYAILRQPKER